GGVNGGGFGDYAIEVEYNGVEIGARELESAVHEFGGRTLIMDYSEPGLKEFMDGERGEWRGAIFGGVAERSRFYEVRVLGVSGVGTLHREKNFIDGRM